MSTKIKICGLTREEDIEAVNEFLPDYIGFIFAQKWIYKGFSDGAVKG